MNLTEQHDRQCTSTTEPASSCPRTDIHLRIWLGDVVFECAATAAATHNLIRDWHHRRWYTIEILLNTEQDLKKARRLPCERLFLP